MNLEKFLQCAIYIEQKNEKKLQKKINIKINQGKQANQQLLVHLHNRSIQSILEQTKQELLEKLKQYPLILKVIDLDETPSRKNLKNELENYCSDIKKSSEIWNNRRVSAME